LGHLQYSRSQVVRTEVLQQRLQPSLVLLGEEEWEPQEQEE
jgi:hypothetical protein